MAGSIRRRLTLSFVGLAAAPLVLAGAVLAWQSFRVQRAQTLVFQSQVAQRVGAELSFFFRNLEAALANDVRGIQLNAGSTQVIRDLLETTQTRHPAFIELSLVEDSGRERLRVSEAEVFGRADLRDVSDKAEFSVPFHSVRPYYGPVVFAADSGEPVFLLSLPVPDPDGGRVRGVLVARVRFKPIWDVVASQSLDPGQDVYVVSSDGEVVAHRNPSVVLRKTRSTVPEKDGFTRGLDGSSVALAHEHVAFGGDRITVAAEQEVWTAVGLAIRVVSVVLGSLVLVFLVAGGLGVHLVRRIVRPVEALSAVARAIQAGEEGLQAPVESDDEIGELAETFNRMTGRLRGTMKTLEGEVAERRAAQEELAAEKERLAVTLRSIGDGVIATDVHGRVVLMNKMAEELTGWVFAEARGQELKRVFSIVNANTREPCENPVEKVIATGEIQGLANHTVLVARDGREFIIADSGSPIRDQESTIVGVVLVFRDVTTQERMEEEIARAQKLESISVLAGGIAHDFNNLLTAILGNLSLARLEVKPDEPIDESLAEAEAAGMRARDLTQQLLTFSRGGAPVKKLSNLEKIVVEASRFACTGSAVACHVTVPDTLWCAEVDAGQIAQVVNNLVLNAVQAMPSGGVVAVRAENVVLERGNRYALEPGNYVRAVVQDQGTGIPPNLLPRIFDPFFTTKQRGSGLGLAVSYSIVSQHGGKITVESTLGEGAAFEVLLPAVPEKFRPCTDSGRSALSPGQGKVLVMDDEGQIRALLVRLLVSLGFQVQGAADGVEAVALYRNALEAGEPFSAVITDLTVPGGMGGREMAAELLKLDPTAKVVVSSGYANDPILANFRDFGFTGVVAKPYRVKELYEELSRVLGAPSATKKLQEDPDSGGRA